MSANKHTLFAMLLAVGIAFAQNLPSPVLAAPHDAPPTAICIDVPDRGGTPPLVPLTEYTVALLADTIQPDPPNHVLVRATLLFKKPSPGYVRSVYPWVINPQDRDDFYVQCKDPLDPDAERYLPDVKMEVPGPNELTDLIGRLKNPAVQTFLKETSVASWPMFLTFSREFQRVPPGRFSPDRLLRDYFFSRRTLDPIFLTGIPYRVGLTSPGSSSRDPFFALEHHGTAQTGQQTPDSRDSRSPTAQAKGPPPIAPRSDANPAVSLKPVHQAPVDVTVRFGANQDQWQRLIQNKPDLISTFDYCNGTPVPSGAGTYKLQCTLRPDRKLPIRIAGFDELMIDPDGPPLDELLKVTSYKYPYPSGWARPTTEFVSVPAGSLRNVLAMHMPLSQDIPGCQLEVSPTIENIVSGTLTIPPQGPCKPYDISFKRLPLAPDAAVTEGCIPGAAISVPIQNNVVTCWISGAQSGKVTLKAHLLRGFRDVLIEQRTADFELDYPGMQTALAPSWPYGAKFLEAGESPTYAPQTVRLVDGSGAACDGTVGAPVNGNYQLPTLSEMGCRDIPRQMTITFQQDGGVQGSAPADSPGAPPLGAFKAKYEDTVDLASAPSGKTIALDDLKRPLPVRFSAEDSRAFDAQFGTVVGNTQFPGVFVFQGATCSGKSGGSFVRFTGPYNATGKWPIRAAGYDAGESPLTLCAVATVKDDGAGPYLTFDLKGSRAIGPRRAIVISESPNVINNGGSRALSTALEKFVDQISTAVNNKAPLSPINVFIASSAGELKPLFSGEKAATEPQSVKSFIAQNQERTDQATPDFRLLRFTPELKNASGEYFDHVIFVMDGSDISQENTDILAGLTYRIRNPDSISLLITASNCGAWKQSNPNFSCAQLPAGDVPKRTDMLLEAFSKLILPPQVQAANQQAEPPPGLHPTIQPSTPAPAPPPPARNPARR